MGGGAWWQAGAVAVLHSTVTDATAVTARRDELLRGAIDWTPRLEVQIERQRGPGTAGRLAAGLRAGVYPTAIGRM